MLPVTHHPRDPSQYAVVGVAVTGAGWYLTRLARGPDGPFSFELC
jgi:hypothetical protein